MAINPRDSHAAHIDENSRPLPPLTAVACTVTSLYRAHAGFVERALRHFGIAERDLADTCQEVFVVVHRRLPEFEGRASAQTWLYRIAWNVASEHRRRAYRRRELLEGSAHDDAASELDAPDECVASQRSITALLDAIDRLDPEKREALICHELEEQPMIAVAQRLRIPLKTAFSRLYAARRAVKLDLHKQGWACLPWWSFSFERMAQRLAPARRLDSLWLASPARSLLVLAFVGVVPTARLATEPTARPTTAVAASPRETAVGPVEIASREPPSAAPALTSTHRPRMHAVAAAPTPTPTTLDFEELTVTRTGEVDLGPGPFGDSPLAEPPLVEPQRHPRAKLIRAITR